MLSETVQACTAEMSKAFQQLHIEAQRLDDAQLTRSHRCWPARVWSVVVLGLVIYLIFQHSFHDQEHGTHRRTEHEFAASLATLTQRLESVESRLTPVETPPVVTKRWWQR